MNIKNFHISNSYLFLTTITNVATTSQECDAPSSAPSEAYKQTKTALKTHQSFFGKGSKCMYV
jgi:hypothetical protein